MKIVVTNYWILLANIFDCSFNMKISFTAFLNNDIDMIETKYPPVCIFIDILATQSFGIKFSL